MPLPEKPADFRSVRLLGQTFPVAQLERYLGPVEEWIGNHASLIAQRFRQRGWAVADTDPVETTFALLRAGRLPTLAERWPDQEPP